jgi:RNase adapter protein RapZ
MTIETKPVSADSAIRIVLVTGMSGAGKTTVLKVLEDLGYECVDNLPLTLLSNLLATKDDVTDHGVDRPLALGIDMRTRAFDAQRVIDQLKNLRAVAPMLDIRTLFLDCAGEQLAQRYSETRRRHPLALDRPVADGIAREREMLAPLRRWADVVIDTSDSATPDLKRKVSDLFRLEQRQELTITVLSFGYARGLPRDADLVFDMRFVRNPHWVDDLRPKTGLDAPVGAYIEGDSAFQAAYGSIESLILTLLPRYMQEGKSYLTIAFGCTGGKHRSVFTAERLAKVLRSSGYNPTVSHRDLAAMSGGAEIKPT